LLLVLILAGCDKNEDAASSPERPEYPRISVVPAAANWPRQALVIPELAAVPTLDGTFHPEVWEKAAVAELTFPMDSAAASPSEARYRAGHRAGVLYLTLEFDWHSDQAPTAQAKKLNDNIWGDDCSEVLLSKIDDLEHPNEIAFNLAGFSVASRLTVNRQENSAPKVAPLECTRKIQVRKTERAYVAEIALPLKEILGIDGAIGDLFRLNFYRFHPNGKPPELFWSPIKGQRNCRSDFYGVAVLAGAEAGALVQNDLAHANESQLMLLDDWPAKDYLRGRALEWIVQCPLARTVKDMTAINMIAVLRNEAGEQIYHEDLKLSQWPCGIALDTASLQTGDYQLELRWDGGRALYQAIPIHLRDWIFIEATDESCCKVEGRSQNIEFPRTVGRNVRQLGEHAKLSVTVPGSAFYLQFPLAFQSPGPFYSWLTPTKLRWNIDAGPWHEVSVLSSDLEFPLEEHLRDGMHTITIESLSRFCQVAGIRAGREQLNCVSGRILTSEYGELLTDVRAQIFAGDKLVRDETVRNPLDGKFVIVGAPAGASTLKLIASGWKTYEQPIELPAGTTRLDVGEIILERDPRVHNRREMPGPCYGRSVCISPGESFSTLFSSWTKYPPKAFLVSAWKKIPVELSNVKKLELGQWNGVASGTFGVPAGIPFDMYDLQLVFEETRRNRTNTWTEIYGQAVCVREALGESFFVAGCGHMNTWGQQTSEYLARCAELAQLAGARTLLVANEVNAAYVSGALSGLRIPYAVVCGNHTMGRWEDFYPKSYVIDDGPLRIVTHGVFSYESWGEAERLFAARPEATNRVLLCFEHFAPVDLITNQKINLIFDGHSDDPHPERDKFPKGTLHVRAPDQHSLRWISMTRTGLAETMSKESKIPVLDIPRFGKAPLRADYSAPNDGSAQQQSVTVTNDYETPFPTARLRLVLARQVYSLKNAKLIQSFDSDDGKSTVMDIEVVVPAKGAVTVTAVHEAR
jgi:hypothetical protein